MDKYLDSLIAGALVTPALYERAHAQKHMAAHDELSPEGYGAVPGVAPPIVPFDQASHVVFEEGPSWTGLEIKAESQTLEQKPIPANGYLRNIWVEVETTAEGEEGEAGEETPKTMGEYPFTILSKLEFQDQGGHMISGLTGYNWYLADKYGAYTGVSDLKEVAMFKSTKKNPNFTVIIPCELAPTGFGSLTNMTEATKYQLQPTIASEANSLKKAKKQPKFKIQTWIELWTLPEARTLPEPEFPEGRDQEQRPPLEGTIQFWTEQSGVKVNTGWQQLVLTRMGQMIRNHIFVCYKSGAPSDAVMPKLTQVNWSRVKFKTFGRTLWKSLARTQLGAPAQAIETGVFPLIYSLGQQRYAGANETNTWLPTVNATRFELEGEFTEGEVTILTNDVAVAATSEAGRRETPGQTSWHAGRTVT